MSYWQQAQKNRLALLNEGVEKEASWEEADLETQTISKK